MNNSGETTTFKFSGFTSPFKAATQPNSVISDYSTTQPLYPFTLILGGSGNTFTSQANTFVSLGDFDTTWAPVLNYNAGLPGISFGNKNSSLAGGVNIANYNITNTSNSDAGTFIDNISGTIYAPGHSVVIGCVSPNLNGSAIVAIGSYQPVAPNGAIRSLFLGGYSNTKNNDGDINSFIGSSSCTIGGTTNWGAIINSNSSSIQGGNYNSIFNGTNINISLGNHNTILGGENHTIKGNYNAVVGGYGHTFANQYSSNLFVGGGLSHTIEGGDRHGIIGGNGNYFYGGEQNYGVGGLSNQVFISNNSGIIGGEYCSVYNGFGTKHNGIYNGAYNKIITDAKDYNTIINGSGNTISGTSYYSSIINGSGNTIGSYSGVIMIGCNNRTADASNTTYVENLKIFGQAQSNSNNVGSISSGTTLDFNTGNIQYFQLTSGSTIVLNATNYKDGATYIVKVKQPTSGTNATMTFTSPLFKFPNGVAPTLSTGNSQEDILSFICIGTTLYGNIQKTFI
jgi:hypothetical protein